MRSNYVWKLIQSSQIHKMRVLLSKRCKCCLYISAACIWGHRFWRKQSILSSSSSKNFSLHSFWKDSFGLLSQGSLFILFKLEIQSALRSEVKSGRNHNNIPQYSNGQFLLFLFVVIIEDLFWFFGWKQKATCEFVLISLQEKRSGNPKKKFKARRKHQLLISTFNRWQARNRRHHQRDNAWKHCCQSSQQISVPIYSESRQQ